MADLILSCSVCHRYMKPGKPGGRPKKFCRRKACANSRWAAWRRYSHYLKRGLTREAAYEKANLVFYKGEL